MKTMFGGRGPGELGAFARTGWGTLVPINGEVEEVQGFAESGWGTLVPVGTGEPAPLQYATALFGADIQQARIQAPRIGQFDFDIPSPGLPDFGDLALPPAAPEPPAPPAPPPAPEPAPEPPTVEITPEEFLFPVGIPSLACQTENGTFTLLDPATLAVITTGLAALPAGASLLPPTDPRCAAFLRAPAAAAAATPTAPAEGVSTTTLAIGAAAVVAVIALLSR